MGAGFQDSAIQEDSMMAACRVIGFHYWSEIVLNQTVFQVMRVWSVPCHPCLDFSCVSRVRVNRVSRVRRVWFSVLASMPCQPCPCQLRHSLLGGRRMRPCRVTISAPRGVGPILGCGVAGGPKGPPRAEGSRTELYKKIGTSRVLNSSPGAKLAGILLCL